MSTSTVNRREALRRLAIGGAGMATLPTWVESLSALAFDHAHLQRKPSTAATAWKPKALTPHQNRTVVTLTELIIPQTETPGATAAKVNEFIDAVLSDAPKADRDKFLGGLSWVDARMQRDHKTTFVAATPDQQVALLTVLSQAADAKNAAEQAAARPKPKNEGTGQREAQQQATQDAANQPGQKTPEDSADVAGRDFFTALKSMTITGYYTSEVGMREELGDDGTLFFAEFKGCTHPEHQKA